MLGDLLDDVKNVAVNLKDSAVANTMEMANKAKDLTPGFTKETQEQKDTNTRKEEVQLTEDLEKQKEKDRILPIHYPHLNESNSLLYT